jgi:hypothetical protein
MGQKVNTALLMAFACSQLCSGALLAKPTRPTPRDSARKPIAATPTWHEVSHARPTHHADTATRVSPHAASNVASRPAKQPLIVNNRAEVRAEAAYASVDTATLDRVHIWELTHRNPPATHPAPASSDSVLADDAGASSNLVRTASDLPRTKSIEEASTPVILPSLYDQRGRLVVPAPLYGSHEVLLHQNQMADRDGLGRVQDDADLLGLRREKKLVELPTNEALRVDDRLPANRRYSRPWTAQFLAALARDHYASFHQPLQVNSAVRTVEFQQRLLRTNGNAAPSSGDTASPHLTGQAIDIAKRGLTITEIAWMRAYLQPLIEQGKIDVEEEFQQSCFHISVYRSYLPPAPAHVTVASARPPEAGPSY